MKKRFEEVMDMVDFKDLLRMKQDLDNGGQEINRMVETKIKQEIKKQIVTCTTCTNNIHAHSENNFTLIFGAEGLKRKASFCGLDCMEYFVKNLKELMQRHETQVKNIPDLKE